MADRLLSAVARSDTRQQVSEREHPRMPYTVQVEFRTASSFLVAYSINLSRGGLFLETDADVPTGAAMTLDFSVPNVGVTSVNGTVAWRRALDDTASGPPGIGIEFQDITPQLGALIDRLAASFRGVQVLLLSGDRQDRTTLARNIKSIFSTAEITQAADKNVASSVLTSEIDIVIVDVDFDLEGGLEIIRHAKLLHPPVPTIAITSNASYREQAINAGTDELLQNPPPFADLQVVLVRALGKPVSIGRIEGSGGVDVDL
ncbi:MAG TPA: TIGR02266 family protein [Kofleriaceae bacterium]|nr:TIGR02266 family protein [Kofleriaceae bacterium]